MGIFTKNWNIKSLLGQFISIIIKMENLMIPMFYDIISINIIDYGVLLTSKIIGMKLTVTYGSLGVKILLEH